MCDEIRIRNAKERVEIKQVCERFEDEKQVDANTTSPTETAVQNPLQFSDCESPTTKEEVKGEEV